MTMFASGNTAFQRAVLDAIPSMVFILDENAHILDANHAALSLLGSRDSIVFRKLCGDVLLCVHARETEGGCGTTTDCTSCEVRRGAALVASGERIERRFHEMSLEVDGRERRFSFLVSASPIDFEGQRLALLALEDVTELMALRQIVPICSYCKRVRNDDAYWENVEEFLSRSTGLDFSHGICPECAARHTAELLGE